MNIKQLIDKGGRKFTLAKWVFIVASFYMLCLTAFLPFGWISGPDYVNAWGKYGILIGINVLGFVAGNVGEYRIKNGNKK